MIGVGDDGRASWMTGHKYRCGWPGWARCATPSTSPAPTTQCPGASLAGRRRSRTPQESEHTRLSGSIGITTSDMESGAGAAYRARLAVSYNAVRQRRTLRKNRPLAVLVLVTPCFTCMAGQGFEPWKAAADGFIVRCRAVELRQAVDGTPPAVPSACPSWRAPAVIHG
jgi:hypothetical protein